MTERVKGLTITLEEDIRIDEIEPLMKTIKMIRGVSDVSPVISESGDIIVKTDVKGKSSTNYTNL